MLPSTRNKAIRVIADHAVRRDSAAWTCDEWFAGFLKPLFSQGIFLPPLLAWEIFAAAEGKARSRVNPAAHRDHLKEYEAFFRWLTVALRQGQRVPQTSPSRFARSKNRDTYHIAADQLAADIARNLMEQVDVSGFSHGAGFDAGQAVICEADRILQRRPDDPRVQRLVDLWEIIDRSVVANDFTELISTARSLEVEVRSHLRIDPFVTGLLAAPTEAGHRELIQLQGDRHHAKQPRKVLWHDGELAGRELGPLPEQLDRLAPSELVLLGESDLWLYFIHRATEGGLLQRFHYDTEPDRMIPRAYLQVDLMDDDRGTLHRLVDPPHPPVISWYRALAVELTHHFVRLCELSHWHPTVALSSRNTQCVDLVELTDERSALLSKSPRNAFEELVRACPRAFTVAALDTDFPQGFEDDRPRQVDLWMRVAIGPEVYGDPPEHVTSHRQRAVHIERCRNGDWGIATDGDCAQAHSLEVAEFPLSYATPADAAIRILCSVLGVGDRGRGEIDHSVELL